jgi:hypothetical protein
VVAGTQAAALAFGGDNPPPATAATEEWTWSRFSINSYNHSFLTFDFIINNQYRKLILNVSGKKKHSAINRKRRRTSS